MGIIDSLKFKTLEHKEKFELRDLLWELFEDYYSDPVAIKIPQNLYFKQLKNPKYYVNVIHFNDKNYKKEIIGICEYLIINDSNPVFPKSVNMGVIIKSKYRKKGIGTHFFSETIKHLEEKGFEWVTCNTLSRNLNMKYLLNKLNLKFRCVLKDFVKVSNTLEDLEYYDLDLRENIPEGLGKEIFFEKGKVEKSLRKDQQIKTGYVSPKSEEDIRKRIIKNIVEKRYFKQSELKEVKLKIFLRQYEYYKLIEQTIRNQNNTMLNDNDIERWDRQISHPLIIRKKIRDARVVVFGVGGIGTNILLGLIYSGVHNFILVDHDKIELSNLNRQTLYTPEDIGKIKVKKAKERLLKINPNANIEIHNININYPKELNILEINEAEYPRDIDEINKIIKISDYIINALDLFGAPYLINDLCIKNRKPFYWGVVNQTTGDLFNYYPEETACLRCIFGDKYLRFRTNKQSIFNSLGKTGNIGDVVIATGSIISQNIINDICGYINSSQGHFIIVDLFNYEIIKIPVIPHKQCQCREYFKK